MAKQDKQAKADGSAAEAGAGAETKLTRRSFVAKAGLTAAALGVAGSIPAVAASCGSSSSSSSSSASPGAPGGEATVVRFVFAPDPIWNYMKDTGIVARYEEKYNMKIVNTTTWDETAWFVGGHADIASTGQLRDAAHAGTPARSSSLRPVQHDAQHHLREGRLPVPDHRGPQGQEDLRGGAAPRIMWRGHDLKKYGLDLKLGGGDFKCNVQEFDAMPTSLEKGDIDACVGLIDYEIPYMVERDAPVALPRPPPGGSSTASTSTRRSSTSA